MSLPSPTDAKKGPTPTVVEDDAYEDDLEEFEELGVLAAAQPEPEELKNWPTLAQDSKAH